MTTGIGAAQEPLRLEEIEPRPKQVARIASYRDIVGLGSLDPKYGKDLLHFVRCVENGTPLPSPFYRTNRGRVRDEALRRDGVMHLHLGHGGSDVLHFLMQFRDYVVLLEVNDHTAFDSRPPAHQIRVAHWGAVTSFQAGRAAATRKKVLSIRERLGIKQPD